MGHYSKTYRKVLLSVALISDGKFWQFGGGSTSGNHLLLDKENEGTELTVSVTTVLRDGPQLRPCKDFRGSPYRPEWRK